jgi:hypothetical protein
MLGPMTRSTEVPAAGVDARSTRPRAAARLAALIVGTVFAYPVAAGAWYVVRGAAVDCFECGTQTTGPWVLGFGILGWLLAVGIWRKVRFALAIGLFLAALSTAIFGALVATLLSHHSFLPLEPEDLALAGGAAVSIVAAVLLVIALREEMAAAGARARLP